MAEETYSYLPVSSYVDTQDWECFYKLVKDNFITGEIMSANFPETERHLDLVSSTELLLSQVGINTFGLVWFSFNFYQQNSSIETTAFFNHK